MRIYWSTGSSSSSIVVNPLVTTEYTVTGFLNACVSVATATVFVGSYPTTPTITANGNVLTSSAVSNNQWYLGNTIISGATAQTFTATQGGIYKVVVNSQYGCSSSSDTVSVSFAGIEEIAYINTIKLSPNPVKDMIYITSAVKESKSINYTIYSISGQMVKSGIVNLNSAEPISVNDLTTGVYEIKFNIKQSNSSYKFVKE